MGEFYENGILVKPGQVWEYASDGPDISRYRIADVGKGHCRGVQLFTTVSELLPRTDEVVTLTIGTGQRKGLWRLINAVNCPGCGEIFRAEDDYLCEVCRG